MMRKCEIISAILFCILIGHMILRSIAGKVATNSMVWTMILLIISCWITGIIDWRAKSLRAVPFLGVAGVLTFIFITSVVTAVFR